LTLDGCFNSWQADGCGWNIGYLWRSMGWFGHAAVTLLVLMLVNTIAIVGDRLYRYSTAARQSRAFVRTAASALLAGRFHDVIAIAARNRHSHVAAVVAAGLNAFCCGAAKHYGYRSHRDCQASLSA
jgi:uncharacterized protein HemY